MTKVVEVYTNLKTAGEEEGLKTAETIRSSIRDSKKLARGHKWLKWSDVSSELQEKYLENNTLPKEFGRAGRKVRQTDATTGKQIKVHDSIGVIVKNFRVGHESVKKACDNETKMKGYKWEWVV
jgi:hypothetical protein